MLTPTTTERVPRHTGARVNREIEAEARERVRRFDRHRDGISRRLAELDREWDIERVLETNASSLALAGIVLGATIDRRWLALPGLVTAFLLQHAVQGWCPPVPILRRLGFRTASEIERERHALKAVRGDYAGVERLEHAAETAFEAAGP